MIADLEALLTWNLCLEASVERSFLFTGESVSEADSANPNRFIQD